MKRWFWAICCLLAMLVTTSCPKRTSVEWKFYSPKSFKIFVDDRLVQDGRLSQIIQAAKNWEISTNYIVSFNIQIIDHADDSMFLTLHQMRIIPNKDIDDSIYIIFANSKLLKNNGYEVNGQVLALCTQEVNSYRVISIVQNQLTPQAVDKFDRLIMHELGHALGLSHTNPKVVAMLNPTLPFWPKCLNKIDLENFCEVWNCSVDKMNYCNLED